MGTRVIRAAWLLVLLSLPDVGAAESPPVPPTGALRGIVRTARDMSTDASFSGYLVHVRCGRVERTASAPRDGRFVLDGLPHGLCAVRAVVLHCYRYGQGVDVSLAVPAGGVSITIPADAPTMPPD